VHRVKKNLRTILVSKHFPEFHFTVLYVRKVNRRANLTRMKVPGVKFHPPGRGSRWLQFVAADAEAEDRLARAAGFFAAVVECAA
jgi:hypothetical protein